MLARSPRFLLLLGSCLGLCLFNFTCKLIWKWFLERVPVQMVANGQGVCIGGCFEVVLPKEFDSKCFESFHFILCFFVSILSLTLGGLGFYHFASLIYLVKLSDDVDKRCSCWVSVDTSVCIGEFQVFYISYSIWTLPESFVYDWKGVACSLVSQYW
jgi:hypothetical protein